MVSESIIGNANKLYGRFLEVAKSLANQMMEDKVKEKAGLGYDRKKTLSGR